MKKATKKIILRSWLIILFLSLFFIRSNDVSAICNSSGYCYDTGTDPAGGQCGLADHDGAWWDTCFGLSWQYYEWPAGWDKDILIFGSPNSGGSARVSAQCREYGGFWFLGYEVYNPSTGASLGYQVAKPKVSMLAAFGGRTALYPFSGLSGNAHLDRFVPKNNPRIAELNPGLSTLRGSKYGDANTIQRNFLYYTGMGDIVSDSTDFSQINWFCAKSEDHDDGGGGGDDDDNGNPETPTSYARGRSVVKENASNWARTAWSSNGETSRIGITIQEGDTRNVIFRHRLVARGEYAQPIGYVIVDSTGATLANSFYDYQGVSMEDSISVYEESIPFDSAGSYCQTLTITYDRPVGQQVRTSTSCVDVTVEEKPTQILGRVEVSVGEQTISSGWNAGVDEPAVLDVTIHEGESVDVYFDEYMKGIDGTNKKINYEITNSYYLGKKKTGVFNYDISNSDVENNISNSFVDEVKKTMTICETLHFTHLGTTQTAEACARITLDKPTKTVGKPGDASSATQFTAHVDPYLSIKAEQTSLRQEGGINELLRTGTSVTIATNNTSGYTATITSGLDSRDQNAGSLYNSASNSYIPSLLNSTLKKDFPVNSWGFSFDDTEDGNNESTYNRLVPSDSAFPYVFSESNHPDEKIHDVFFAAKADVTKASGTYSADVSLKAVAAVNPLVHETIDDLYYMQDISDAIIDSMVVNTQYKLYDRRDGKGYWVAKLEDGNVWMTQNLDFVLRDGQCLYEGDSDVTRNESSLSYCFQTNGGTSTSVKDSWLDQNTPRLYYEDYYMAGISNSDKGYSYRPASDELLGKEVSFSVESDDTSYSTALILPNYLVDGKTPTFYNNTTDCANANNVPVEVCEHWFIGTYYTDGIAFDGYQPNTICPGRWTLPRENFSTLVAGKQVEDLLGAPYYMNYSGFYGYRNASIKYDQWLFFPQYIAYMYGNSWGSKNASSYKPYPAVSYGWGLDPFFATINPQSTSSDYLQDLKSNEGQATAIRCVAKKGF